MRKKQSDNKFSYLFVKSISYIADTDTKDTPTAASAAAEEKIVATDSDSDNEVLIAPANIDSSIAAVDSAIQAQGEVKVKTEKIKVGYKIEGIRN